MSNKTPTIIAIPIDARPVSYSLLKENIDIIDGTKIYLPPKELLGNLNKTANIDKIIEWFKDILSKCDVDIVLLALDTIAYGGLISSRKTECDYETIKSNIDRLKNVVENLKSKPRIYAFSSIMRISNNNVNEEEKSYWDKYGEKLFRFSYLSHKLISDYNGELEKELTKLSREIPFEIIDDYLNTRKRNFDINNYYISLMKQETFDYLVYSQDDTAEFGLNVEEKDLLLQTIKKEKLTKNVAVKTGADEILLSLLTRSLIDFYNKIITVKSVFFDDCAKNIVSRYEDVTIEQSVLNTIKLSGAKECKSDKNADIEILLNCPNKIQNDICLEILEDDVNNHQADCITDYLTTGEHSNVIIADVKNANGADNYLIWKLLEKNVKFSELIGFAAWNTTGNTLGSTIATGIIKFLAIKLNLYNENAFKKAILIRLLDDWAYQSNVRKILRDNTEKSDIKTLMGEYERTLMSKVGIEKQNIKYSFPWDRTFEVEIICQDVS